MFQKMKTQPSQRKLKLSLTINRIVKKIQIKSKMSRILIQQPFKMKTNQIQLKVMMRRAQT